MDTAIGGRIKSARRAAGLTQEALSRRTELSLQAVGDIERGVVTDPHISSLRQIADALGVPIRELLEEEPEAALAGSSPKVEAPQDTGQSLLERGREAQRQDEEKQAQAINRLFASEGKLSATHVTEFEEDAFRAELRSRGFPDEYFESFIWPLVTLVNEQERELSRLREIEARVENTRSY